jgi:hypothetical protein
MVRRKRARQTSESDVGMFDMAEIAIPERVFHPKLQETNLWVLDLVVLCRELSMIKPPKKNKREPKGSEGLHGREENGRAMSWLVSYCVKDMRALNSQRERDLQRKVKSQMKERSDDMCLRQDLDGGEIKMCT